jgi:pimeloyl-ACP methyl ester carboxylesterase
MDPAIAEFAVATPYRLMRVARRRRTLSPVHVERVGAQGPIVLLVHGSVVPGWQTWHAQRPLADRYRLVVPHRSGYPPNPPLERIDFEAQGGEIAQLIEPETHLVGHSYGGVVSLFAAAIAGDRLRSLTVIEPPAFGVARGNRAVEELIARIAPVLADAGLGPREFLLRFVGAVGATPALPDPLPPEVVASAQATRVERPPWEAEIPFEALRQAAVPVLVVSGGHSAAFDAVCDVMADELRARRAVIRGAGHSVQRSGDPFNRQLSEFIDSNS